MDTQNKISSRGWLFIIAIFIIYCFVFPPHNDNNNVECEYTGYHSKCE